MGDQVHPQVDERLQQIMGFIQSLDSKHVAAVNLQFQVVEDTRPLAIQRAEPRSVFIFPILNISYKE